MERRKAYLRVQNHGLFEDFEFELKPVTVLVGRNSAGKSVLLQLIWLLLSLEPDRREWLKLLDRAGGGTLVERLLEKLKAGGNADAELKTLIKLALETYPRVAGRVFDRRFKTTFPLFRDSPETFSRNGGLAIEIAGWTNETPRYVLRIRYDAGSKAFSSEYTDLRIPETLVEGIKVVALKPVEETLFIVEIQCERLKDRARLLIPPTKAFLGLAVLSIAYRLIRSAAAPWLHPNPCTFFCVDGRAGLVRLLRPWRLRLIGSPRPDKAFAGRYYYLLDLLYRGRVNLEIVKDFLREIGVESIHVRPKLDLMSLYVRLWTGSEVPIELSPSGVREVVIPIISLAADTRVLCNVIIEEPEAHLHPAAITALVKVVARSVEELRKLVLISTHSDLLVAKLSNLIESSTLSEEDRKKLGLEDTLDPGVVAVYLLRQDPAKKRTVIEKVEVSESGIAESELTRIAIELANESSLISIAKRVRG